MYPAPLNLRYGCFRKFLKILKELL
jgi:hypothetical protein